ncbi:site-specific DNA-methyltransferase [Treponema sp.]|uniref:site-specific DNA-methyltransferase n=1 Tax=Treponema sp. TaxID=166 RepID=UPI0025DF023E|nr:site-specific DNA-methyltransferase [Treponema sp.]MBR4322276.1 site-specific DNA-methyltransferase [Treponema sp.]
MPFLDTPETNALKSKVEKLLLEIPYFTDENKNLKINVIKDYADNGNVKLLEPLLKNTQTKKAFFTPVLDSFVFDTAKFKEFLEYSSACNSYSKYLGQKIGLYMGDSSLLDRNEVVLNFPFKDCVLEGGQRKEDGLDTYYEYNEKKGEYEEIQSKRREVFYNEVLAQDEIDSLFSPKAFCDAKRYEKGKSGKCVKVNRDAELNKKRGLSEDTITDNLIIKGNNLLALHSLKKEFAGKVKLIYIDPPYNTGSDSFAYNDNFNHSSWLTFMKNRLEIARELLREDGAIFVQCDDNEQAYLKILCDEVFGRVNFISSIVWKGRGGRQDSKFIAQIHETIQVFAKNINSLAIYKEEVADDDSYTGKDEKGEYKLQLLRKWGSNSRRFDRPNLYFGVDFEGETVFPILPDGSDGCWRWSKSKIESAIKENLIVLQNKNDKIELYEKIYKTGDTKEKVFTSWFEEGFSGEAANHLKDLFNEKVFDFPKPESLLKRILEISTKPTDLVLDYHLGSGTTASVAHKMNRQYIGIEQMDYIESVTVERLKKVIDGEQGGISKAQNWQGGGSFVYLELAKKNETALEQISACKSLEELTTLFDELCSKYFLHYNVRVKEFRKEIESERFKQLSLKQQKEMFSRMLDLNQLYVNADDRHDKNTGLTKDDIAITEDFYKLKKDGE